MVFLWHWDTSSMIEERHSIAQCFTLSHYHRGSKRGVETRTCRQPLGATNGMHQYVNCCTRLVIYFWQFAQRDLWKRDSFAGDSPIWRGWSHSFGRRRRLENLHHSEEAWLFFFRSYLYHLFCGFLVYYYVWWHLMCLFDLSPLLQICH